MQEDLSNRFLSCTCT